MENFIMSLLLLPVFLIVYAVMNFFGVDNSICNMMQGVLLAILPLIGLVCSYIFNRKKFNFVLAIIIIIFIITTLYYGYNMTSSGGWESFVSDLMSLFAFYISCFVLALSLSLFSGLSYGWKKLIIFLVIDAILILISYILIYYKISLMI